MCTHFGEYVALILIKVLLKNSPKGGGTPWARTKALAGVYFLICLCIPKVFKSDLCLYLEVLIFALSSFSFIIKNNGL